MIAFARMAARGGAVLVVLLAVPVAAELSSQQARQALLPHVQQPETTLGAEPIVTTNGDGHAEYLFYGDDWGSYCIDSVTGTKRIQHVARTSLAAGEQPVNPLSRDQLRQAASEYVAAHYPGYTPGMFSVQSGSVDPASDANLYYVHFRTSAPSGASLPSRCLVGVEEDTGSIYSYDEVAVPVIIGTTPLVSEAQAVAIGRAWIAANVSLDPAEQEVLGPDRRPRPVWLRVDVDPLLNQTLVYDISYQALLLRLDAQTGTVIGTDPWARSAGMPRRPPVGSGSSALRFWPVLARGAPVCHSAVVADGGPYIWAGLARSVGLTISRAKSSVTMRCNGRTATLRVAGGYGGGRVAWMRKSRLYLPVRAVSLLTDRVRADTGRRVVMLDPAWRSAPRPPAAGKPALR